MGGDRDTVTGDLLGAVTPRDNVTGDLLGAVTPRDTVTGDLLGTVTEPPREKDLKEDVATLGTVGTEMTGLLLAGS